MRGNRSSSCAFWLAPQTGVVRAIAPYRPVAAPDWERHEQRQLLALSR